MTYNSDKTRQSFKGERELMEFINSKKCFAGLMLFVFIVSICWAADIHQAVKEGDVETKKAEVTSVYEPEEICSNVFSTGEMGEAIKEQSLILNTKKGLIIVTGCSHQGIVEIIKHADKLFDKAICLVFGGFHLGGKPEAELQEIITSFKEIGVEKCGATHCTGDQAIEMFKKAYGENYIPMGTGRILELEKEKGVK
jgi:metal-dependent hydrolase (beta-lactamase superfamily II)